MNLHPPEPLAQHHKLDTFSCGEPVLDEWLKRRAFANQVSGATRTFVVADAVQTVRGYYALTPMTTTTTITVRQAVLSDIDALVPMFDCYRQFYGRPTDLDGAGCLAFAVSYIFYALPAHAHSHHCISAHREFVSRHDTILAQSRKCKRASRS